jgi:hypothetical protein
MAKFCRNSGTEEMQNLGLWGTKTSACVYSLLGYHGFVLVEDETGIFRIVC